MSMQFKDLVYARHSYNSAQRLFFEGHISEATWEKFRLVWMWAGGVSGGIEGMILDRFWEKHGKDVYLEKCERARRICAQIYGGGYANERHERVEKRSGERVQRAR